MKEKIREFIYWKLGKRKRLQEELNYYFKEWKKLLEENEELEKQNRELEAKLEHVFVFPEQFNLEYKKN